MQLSFKQVVGIMMLLIALMGLIGILMQSMTLFQALASLAIGVFAAAWVIIGMILCTQDKG